jgi:hypothetical protein
MLLVWVLRLDLRRFYTSPLDMLACMHYIACMETTNKHAARTAPLGYTISLSELLKNAKECAAGKLPGMVPHSVVGPFDDSRGICIDCAHAPEWSPMGKAIAEAGL